jgi:uncharacterized membrane protein YbaN (DUF454 family)
VNREEIKQILLVYRPGTSDALDPEVAEALALAQSDPELSHWLEEHCARQNALRDKFRQMAIPAGLKEQIISEQAARVRAASRREKVLGVTMAVVLVIAIAVIAVFGLPHTDKPKPIPATLANYQDIMVRVANSGYYMDFRTNDSQQIQSYLANHQAPSDYVLPAGLQKTALAGCSIEDWQHSKATMICFLTGKPLPQGRQADLWFFVVDSSAITDASSVSTPQFTQINGLITATWSQDGKLYLLATHGDEQTIKNYL